MHVGVRPRHDTIDHTTATVGAIGRVRPLADGGQPVSRVAVLLVVFLAGLLVLPSPALIALGVALVIAAERARSVAVERPASTKSSPVVAFAIASVALWLSAVVPFASQPLRDDGAVLLATFAVLPVAAIAACWVPRDRQVGVVLWVASAVGASAAGAAGIVEVAVVGTRRAEGMTHNAILFGDLSLMMALLNVALAPLARAAQSVERPIGPHPLFDRAVGRWRELTVAGSVLGVTAGILSGSRGGWLAVPVMAAVLALRFRHSLHRRNLPRLGAVFAGLSVVAVRLIGSMPVDRARAAVSEVRAYDAARSPFDPAAGTSIGARFEAWRAALWATSEHWLTGVGWGNLQQQFGELAWARYRNPRIAGFDHPHHQLISAAANSGLPGLVAWCAVMAVPGRRFWRSARHSDDAEVRTLGAAGLVVVAGYLVFGLTEAIFEQVVPLAFFAITVGMLLSQLEAPATKCAWVVRARRRRSDDEVTHG